jgi:hypothetical protein
MSLAFFPLKRQVEKLCLTELAWDRVLSMDSIYPETPFLMIHDLEKPTRREQTMRREQTTRREETTRQEETKQQEETMPRQEPGPRQETMPRQEPGPRQVTTRQEQPVPRQEETKQQEETMPREETMPWKETMPREETMPRDSLFWVIRVELVLFQAVSQSAEEQLFLRAQGALVAERQTQVCGRPCVGRLR